MRFDALSSYSVLYVDYCGLEYATSDVAAPHYVIKHICAWLQQVCKLSNADWNLHAFINHLTGVSSCCKILEFMCALVASGFKTPTMELQRLRFESGWKPLFLSSLALSPLSSQSALHSTLDNNDRKYFQKWTKRCLPDTLVQNLNVLTRQKMSKTGAYIPLTNFNSGTSWLKHSSKDWTFHSKVFSL